MKEVLAHPANYGYRIPKKELPLSASFIAQK
jgi:hypothetical protein